MGLLMIRAYEGTSTPRRDTPNNKGLWMGQNLRILT